MKKLIQPWTTYKARLNVFVSRNRKTTLPTNDKSLKQCFIICRQKKVVVPKLIRNYLVGYRNRFASSGKTEIGFQ